MGSLFCSLCSNGFGFFKDCGAYALPRSSSSPSSSLSSSSSSASSSSASSSSSSSSVATVTDTDAAFLRGAPPDWLPLLPWLPSSLAPMMSSTSPNPAYSSSSASAPIAPTTWVSRSCARSSAMRSSNDRSATNSGTGTGTGTAPAPTPVPSSTTSSFSSFNSATDRLARLAHSLSKSASGTRVVRSPLRSRYIAIRMMASR